MQHLIQKMALITLLTLATNAAAQSEMRCRINGAYIKVYGKNEADQKEVCARQGGEFTRYTPNIDPRSLNPRAQAMDSIFGRKVPR
jgi:patatin-like phospholipase/acyl hydrolase